MLDSAQFVEKIKNGLNKASLKILASVAILSSLILIDQLLKYKIRSSGGFYVCNNGISFGLKTENIVFLLIISLSIVFFFLFKAIEKNKVLFLCGILFILGGALSNILDRTMFGCVIDHIKPFLGFLPVFNLADMAISFGAFLIILFSIKTNR